MFTIPLPGTRPLSDTFSYSVSPLYELAASLHTLAQPNPPERFSHWAGEKLSHIQVARMTKDWEYVLPLFRYGIPDTFDPFQTKGVMSINDLYDYFFTLPTEQFVTSLHPLLEQWNRRHAEPPIFSDLREDSDYVKGRFSLFVSSYWQLSFETNWEGIAPLFVNEAERIHASLDSPQSLVALLQSILPASYYDPDTHRIACPTDGPSYEVQHLVLYPSHYYFAEPLLTKKGVNGHLLYSFTALADSTKNAL